ncbi:MAG: hypothetical protein QXD60_03215 [Nanopusillaceae archaeon]
MDWLDKYRSEEYYEALPGLPYVQWNSKQLKRPPMFLCRDQAEAAGFVGDETWQEGIFEFEPDPTSLQEKAEPAFLCETPILAVIKVYNRTLVFRRDYDQFRRGDRVPEGMSFDRSLHRLKVTYMVALLGETEEGYRLLHTDKPLQWTPPAVVGARFSENIYLPLCNLVSRYYGPDLAKYLFAIHLGAKREKVGQAPDQVIIHVPVASLPTTESEMEAILVGPDIAEQLHEWYHAYPAKHVRRQQDISLTL